MNIKIIITLLAVNLLLQACVITASNAEGYDRSEFKYNGSKMWPDVDRDCQDLRQELLIMYSLTPVAFKTSRECRVKTGRWFSPYSNTIHEEPFDLDVEHIVPLAWAYKHGASEWSTAEKVMLATDLDNLLLVRKKENRSKGAKGPDRWMPPHGRYHAEYMYRWNRIVTKYGLLE